MKLFNAVAALTLAVPAVRLFHSKKTYLDMRHEIITINARIQLCDLIAHHASCQFTFTLWIIFSASCE